MHRDEKGNAFHWRSAVMGLSKTDQAAPGSHLHGSKYTTRRVSSLSRHFSRRVTQHPLAPGPLVHPRNDTPLRNGPASQPMHTAANERGMTGVCRAPSIGAWQHTVGSVMSTSHRACGRSLSVQTRALAARVDMEGPWEKSTAR